MLQLAADGGRLKPLPGTDSTGRAITWWYSNYQFGTFTLSVRAGTLQRYDTLTVEELQNVNGTLELSADVQAIYADHCVTKSYLTASLKDQYGTAITGDTILFAASRGGWVDAWAVTDIMGLAQASFCADVPSPEGDSSVVVARHRTLGLTDSVRILVVPVSAVNVIVTPARTRGTAGIDSTNLSVSARYADGFDVNGDTAYFSSTCGSFTFNKVQVVNGHAENVWKFCNQTTNAAFRVWVRVVVAGAVDSAEFEVDPGPARRVNIETAFDVINMGERLPAWADVADSLGNPVRSNVPVMFESTIGTISPQSPVATNDSGRANVELSPGTQAGQAVIKATVGGVYTDSTVVTVISGEAASIQLDVPNSSPQVAGTGGQDWTQLRATVHDANGNAVPDGQWVTFTIVHSPGEGCNINGVGQADSGQTAAGLAVATFNAGRASGPVTIQARTYVDSVEISAQASNITIVSGPPHTLDIQPTGVGTDAEIAWDLIVAALVRDEYNNPVRDGIAVFFSVTPDTAMIMSEVVVTGNSPQGQPDVTRAGVAYTVLRYISAATNQTVDITGRTADGVSEMIHFTLPIQQPSISLNCYPSEWHFGVMGDPCRIRGEAIVVDLHGWPINNTRVIYSTTRGRLYTTETGGSQQNYNFTGPPYNTVPGHTALWLRDSALVLFPDAISTEITCEVAVEVEGHPEAFDSQIVNLRRFPPE